jgi:acetyl-CoA carboxylase biotin carboxyl carrier protein
MSENLKSVISPISGVFYSKPAPEQPPFVEEGSQVKKGQTLCLLETMKVFTKIKAPVDGVVTEISIEDENTVEKNQVIMKIKS